MRSFAERKKRTIDFVCQALDLLEGDTHVNSSKYRAKWEAMNETEFTAFMEKLRDNEDQQMVYFEIIEFERDLKLPNIEKCADFMRVPLYEYVALPDVTGNTDNVAVTPERVPVGYIHCKRMPQTILKKNSLSIRVDKKNPLTGQVTADEKTSRNTDVETYALNSMGAKAGLTEFMGPRGDDPVMESEMLSKIAAEGSVSLKDLTSDPKNKVAVNTLNVYIMMQQFVTNLVGPMGLIPSPKDTSKK